MITRPKRVAVYLRVSDDARELENQRQKLQDAAARHGWEIVREYVDDGKSGAKGRDKRQGFNELWNDVSRKNFDLVAAWAVDRLGRSLKDLLNFLDELEDKRVDLYLEKQAIDTSTRMGKMLFQVAGMFAEYERGMIVDRVNAGLDRVKKQHKDKTGKDLALGRVTGLTEAKAAEARTMLAKGVGILKVAKTLKIGTGTIQKLKRGQKVALRENQKAKPQKKAA